MGGGSSRNLEYQLNSCAIWFYMNPQGSQIHQVCNVKTPVLCHWVSKCKNASTTLLVSLSLLSIPILLLSVIQSETWQNNFLFSSTISSSFQAWNPVGECSRVCPPGTLKDVLQWRMQYNLVGLTWRFGGTFFSWIQMFNVRWKPGKTDISTPFLEESLWTKISDPMNCLHKITQIEP